MRSIKLAAIMAVCLSWFPAQQASAVTYYLDNSNTEAELPDGVNYATVTLTQNGTAVDFIVDIDESLFSVPTTSPNFGIQAFAFNNMTMVLADVTGLPGGWTAFVPPTGNSDGFGLFDAQLDATGQSRLDPLTFSVQNSMIADFQIPSSGGGEVNQNGAWFALHIAGFCQPGTGGTGEPDCSDADPTSFWVGGGEGGIPPSEVPVPAAVWLFGSGLLGLVAIARRRKV